MDPLVLAGLSFPVLMVLIFLRVPIGLSMLVVGLFGSWQVYGSVAPLLNQLKNLAYSQFSTHSLSIVPLFLLMGVRDPGWHVEGLVQSGRGIAGALPRRRGDGGDRRLCRLWIHLWLVARDGGHDGPGCTA
jgi:TRAP-type mannitol/chloroaromatic compound transport system permease large subunit